MPIAFNQAGVFSGAVGGPNVLSNPTSLQFGPDGRLYVSEQNGSINAFTVAQDSSGNWVATSHEQLADASGNEIVKSIQNHNDDGSEAATSNRQVTGIVLGGTAETPVIYVTSSDPRIATNNDSNLDTNSGILTQATWNGTSWDVVDLVRGLPRSEENHSTNGMILTEGGTKMLLQVGGFTNNGAPSGFFSYTNEYALSGAILELDLLAIDALPDQTDAEGGQGNTPRTYKYDLPTLDDPNIENVTDGVGEDEFGMDENGPFGGNDGLNMAILPADAPIRIFADGMRNAYDIAQTPDGRIYTVDNGSNGNLGAAPNTETGDDDGDGIPNEALGTPNNGGPGEGEPFQQIVEGGYYYHPNPVRSNQNMAWTVYNNSGTPDTSLSVNSVPDISALVPAGVNIASGFLIDPSRFAGLEGLDPNDPDDRALIDARLKLSGVFVNSNTTAQNDPDGDGPGQQTITILGSSTNGVLAYDSGGAAFGGAIDGKIFVTQFNDNITLLNVNADGTALEPVFEEGPDGIFGTDDDVVQEASGILFVANNSLGVPLANPLDVTQGPNGTLWVAEIGGNEITVLAPTLVIDPANPDSDFDGILNVDDPFLRDATNGKSVTITPGAPTVWEFSQGADDTTPGPDGFGGGLTGVMTDGVTNFEEFLQSPSDRPGQTIQLDNVKFVTAAGGGTTVIEEVTTGDPYQTPNDGQFLFHTGFQLAETVATFTVTWVVKNPGAITGGSDITNNFQQIGGYLGDGTQSNYLKIVAIATNNDASASDIEIVLEDDDSLLQTIAIPANEIFDNAALLTDSDIVFELEIDLAAATATPKATYTTTSGDVVLTGTEQINLAGSKVFETIVGNATVNGQSTGIAAGLFASNFGSGADSFQAVFDSITVSATEAEVPPVAADDSLFTQINAPLAIPVGDLLANDTDANLGDTLTVTGVTGATNGTVALDDNGTPDDASDDIVTFTPDPDFEGAAGFSYTVSDGIFVESANVSVDVSDVAVLFRINTTQATLAALPNDPYNSTLAWIGTGGVGAQSGTQNGLGFAVSTGNISTHNIAGRDASVPDYVPQGLFADERWDPAAAPDMVYSFGDGALGVGTYTANIFAGNGFAGTSAPGTRVFDIEIEGELVFDNVDLSALFGHQVGGLLTWTGQVTDGTLDIAWVRDGVDSVENPTVNGIEILAGAVEAQPLTLSILGGTQTVSEGDGSVFVSIATNRTVPNDEQVTFTYVIEGISATPQIDYAPNATLSGSGTATFTGTATIAGGSSDFQIPINILPDDEIEGSETFTVTITSISSNAALGAVTQATITIEDDDVLVTPGTPIIRINAGGPEVAANDGGIAWSEDQSAVVANAGAQIGTPSEFLRSGSDVSTYGDTTPNGPGVNATGAPDALFTTERFWEPAGTYGYDFTLANGAYTVNLYFDELFFTAPGARIFDVAIEDSLVLDDFDPFVAAGNSNDTTLQSFEVTLTDGELNLDFIKGSANNPNISAIEIIAADDGPPALATLSIAPPVPASVVETGNTGVTTLAFALSFDTPPAEAVTVEYSVDINGTVTPGLTQVLGTANGVITVDVPNDALANGPETVSVTLTGLATGDASAQIGTSEASGTIAEDDTAVPAGEVIYRINSGGGVVAATDGGIPWSADQNPTPTEFLVAGGNNTFGIGTGVTIDTATLPDAPAAIFATERWDPPADAEMQYEFDVAPGTYIVNLYIVEGNGPTSSVGARVFDVAVEGTVPTAFDDIDPAAISQELYGAGNFNSAFVLSHTVEVTDGILDLDFLRGVENPAIRGIEIIAAAPAEPAVDGFNGVTAPGADWSNDNTAPDDVVLNEGVNTLVATGEFGDADYVTFVVAAGQQVTSIELADYVGGANAGFLGLQVGGSVPTQAAIQGGTATLDGGTVYSDLQIGTDILPLLTSTVVEGAGQPTAGIATPLLEGTYTLWFNQNQNLSETTLAITSEAVSDPVAPGVYLPNANGDFVFEAESAEDQAPGNWVFNTTDDLPAGHEAPSGGGYVLATSNHLGNAGGEELTYTFQATQSGFLRVNLVAAFSGSSSTDENDSFTGIFQNGTPLVPLPQQGEALAATEGNAIGDQGFYKTYSSGGNSLDFILANKTWDNNGVPIIYQVEAGETYEFVLKERSSGHKVDRIVLEYFETQPGGGVPNNGQSTVFQTFPLSPQTPPGAEISGRVFADANDNAVDDSEPGLGGVSVTLLDAAGTAVATTSTAPDGSYAFEGLAAGTYSVRFPVDVAGDPLVAQNTGGDDTIDSDASVLDGTTQTVTVAAGDVVSDIDAGYDTEVTLVGAAVLTVNDGANGIEISNFGANAFQISNTGQKNITAIEIDVTDALFPDAVFDPFGQAGDLTAKILQIDAEGGTGVVTPAGGFGAGAIGITYIGAGGTAGYEKIRLEFTNFNPGETLGFSVDMDPNSIAGAAKGTLDSGAQLVGAGGDGVWDVGGIAGGELIGSTFTVEYDDASTSTGKLQGQGPGAQMGAGALSSQAQGAVDVTLTVNGLVPGAEGTYTDGGPQILIEGPAGEIARVLVAKGFIVPFTNEFTTAYAATLDAQLKALEASGFPANNAVEMLYVDVPLNGTVQDISGLFDFTQVAGFDLAVPDATNEYGTLVESRLPLGIVASVIDPATNLPKGEVTSPIHLTFSEDPTADLSLTKTVSDTTPDFGDTVSFTITATNDGPDGASGIEVENVLGDGFALQTPSVLTSTGSFDEATGVWTLGELAVGASATLTFEALVLEAAPPAPDQVVYRVNPGGDQVYVVGESDAADASDPDWLEDTPNTSLNGNATTAPSTAPFGGEGSGITRTGGQEFGTEGSSVIVDISGLPADTAAVAGLFKTERFGVPLKDPAVFPDQPSMEWDFAVENGDYTVNLYFAEVFVGVQTADGIGARVFDVEVEGALVLDDYDIFADVGTLTAVLKSFDATVADGNLDIDFTTVVDNAKISAIEIIRKGAPGGPLDYTSTAEIVAAAEIDPDSSVDNGILGEDDDATVTVTPVAGGINEVTVVATDPDAAEPADAGQFTVSLQEAAASDTVVAYSIGGTATAGADYTALTGTVTIPAGTLSAPINVLVLDDADVEDPETVTVTLSGVSGDANLAIGSQAVAEMTITSEDLPPIQGSAKIEITPGAGLGATTFGGSDKIQITNDGPSDIKSITIDFSTGILPDMVWDPTGSGGDALAQIFTAGDTAGAVGLLTPANPGPAEGADDADPFSQPRNGGWDAITLNFTDFNSGEFFSFTSDVDPNSIQGIPGAGFSGAVSGYELIGSTITVTFTDGTQERVVVSSLYEDGSLGGGASEAVIATDTALAAPTIELVGADDDESPLPGSQHSVEPGATSQVVRVTGTEGANVSLLQMDARLLIASGAAPFDVTADELPFYANEAMAGKSLYTGVIGPDGFVDIPVALLATVSGDTGPDGGLNHFVAVLSDGPYAAGQPVSQTSNTLVVRQSEDAIENLPPEITSADSFEFVEGASGTVFTAMASDPDLDPVSFSLGGDDQDLFAIDPVSGAVTFNATPSFAEGGDNFFDLLVTASDGTLTDTQAVTVELLKDTDGDLVADKSDNAIFVANADQRDTDGDNYGNVIDADLDNDGFVGVLDLGLFRTALGTLDPVTPTNPGADADFDGDGLVGIADLGIFRELFGQSLGGSFVDEIA